MCCGDDEIGFEIISKSFQISRLFPFEYIFQHFAHLELLLKTIKWWHFYIILVFFLLLKKADQ